MTGGVTGVKKSGILVMGGVTGTKSVTGTKRTIVEKDVEKKSVGRAAGNPTMFTGGRALREAPRVHVEKNVGRASGNSTRFTGGASSSRSAPCS